MLIIIYNLQGTLTFKGFATGDAFDSSNRLKAVSGTIGTRINVTGTLGDTDTKEYMLAGGLGGGIGSILYQEAGNDTLTFYSYNHKGDVHSLIDENENIVALYEYDAFGNILTEAIDDASTNSFTFSTREFSELSDLGHWYAREYDPFVGRRICLTLFHPSENFT